MKMTIVKSKPEIDMTSLAARAGRVLNCRNSDTSKISSLAIRAAAILSKDNSNVTGEKKDAHKKAREDAQAIYEAAAIAAAAIAAAAKAQEQKKKREEAVAAILLLLLLAGEDAYHKTYHSLGTEKADEIQISEQAKTFAASRQKDLKEFAGKLNDSLELTKSESEKEKLTEAASRQKDLKEFAGKLNDSLELTKSESEKEKLTESEMARALRDMAKKVSSVMTDTEAQITYGSVQIDRLKRAGFTTKIWMTMEDEKVRPSHVECGEQGAVELSKPFLNGLHFPGDPNGGASEVCNCRCWLVGGSR